MLIADSQLQVWGANTPQRMPCTYRECIDLFTRELAWLKGEDLARVMGLGVCEWLGWAA
jgi:hypothetical protein